MYDFKFLLEYLIKAIGSGSNQTFLEDLCSLE